MSDYIAKNWLEIAGTIVGFIYLRHPFSDSFTHLGVGHIQLERHDDIEYQIVPVLAVGHSEIVYAHTAVDAFDDFGYLRLYRHSALVIDGNRIHVYCHKTLILLF
jgi:hypothetical protein